MLCDGHIYSLLVIIERSLTIRLRSKQQRETNFQLIQYQCKSRKTSLAAQQQKSRLHGTWANLSLSIYILNANWKHLSKILSLFLISEVSIEREEELDTLYLSIFTHKRGVSKYNPCVHILEAHLKTTRHLVAFSVQIPLFFLSHKIDATLHTFSALL